MELSVSSSKQCPIRVIGGTPTKNTRTKNRKGENDRECLVANEKRSCASLLMHGRGSNDGQSIDPNEVTMNYWVQCTSINIGVISFTQVDFPNYFSHCCLLVQSNGHSFCMSATLMPLSDVSHLKAKLLEKSS